MEEHSLSAKLPRFALVALQLAAIAAAAFIFHIEAALGFVKLLPVIAGGFAIHSWLPRAMRTPFFLLLSMGAACYILGPLEGAILIGIGLALIGICHLPIPFAARVALVLAAAALLAALRAGRIEADWTPKVLPILGAMFMFRLIIYLYDLRHEKQKITFSTRLAYFFLLPNVCFPLFPVVDYKMFTRTYYNDDEYVIYQKGVRWMLLGVIQLILYRVVYLHLIPAPSEIVNLNGVLLYGISAYGQYLRISGMFHLIVGILCLFGFNLPATNLWYFLASSFTDMWRRINIYWRDFSQKIIYFPVFMQLRKSGTLQAMVPATLAVFFCSWLLHSYQWFWIRGDFPISPVDIAFWGSVSLLVLITSLLESGRSRQPGGKSARPLFGALSRAAKTLGVFSLMCLLWSLWCSDSLGGWVDVLSNARNSSLDQIASLIAVVTGLLIVGTIIAFIAARGWFSALKPGFWMSGAITTALALLIAGSGFWAQQPENDSAVARHIVSLIEPRLNLRDAEIRTLGYYEGLLGGERTAPVAAPAPVEQSLKAPPDWKSARASGLTMQVDDYRAYDLRPSHSAIFKRAAFNTNEWGMRDKAYAQQKPDNTYRIALVGASVEMGAGVADGENYESFLERKLNEELPEVSGLQYEVLNFSVAGWGIIQQVAKCEMQLFNFEPNTVLVVAHSGEMFVVLRHLNELLQRELPMPERLAEIISRAGVTREMRGRQVMQRLAPYIEEITRWGYGRIVELCREHGVTPVWAFVPLARDFDDDRQKRDATIASMTAWAEAAGFLTIDVSTVFEGRDPATLMVAPWDNHPNPHGNEIIAGAIYDQLLSQQMTIGLGVAH
jgi:hypothetical protein